MYGFSVLIKKADICCEYPFFCFYIGSMSRWIWRVLYGCCDVMLCFSSCLFCFACCGLAVVSILISICLMCLFCMRAMDGVSGPSMRLCSLSFSLFANVLAARVHVFKSVCLSVMRISRTYGG